MFLNKEDYSVVCEESELDILTQSNDATRQKAEQTAIEEVASYLRGRYDTKKAFAAIAENRNAMLVQITVNIAMYYMAFWLPGSMGMDGKQELYEAAINWLKMAASGKATPDLPAYQNESGEDTVSSIRFGSEPKSEYGY